jgi:segregation and condensation protein B
MAKKSSRSPATEKAVRKQAPPRLGKAPAHAVESATTEASLEDLVAELGSGSESDSEVETVLDEANDPIAVAELEADPAPAESEGEVVEPPVEAEASEAAAPAADAPSEPVDESIVRLIDSLPIDPEDDLSEVEGEASPRLVSIVESLLFASSKPLRVKQIRKVLDEPALRQIQLALKHLIAHGTERGIIVAQVAGGFVLQTHPQNAIWVQKLLQAKPVRLSRPQLETLAVIAYRQPVTRPEIDHVRGVDSGAVLKLLLERDLVQIIGKKDEPGRPMLYGTTVHFLEFFNLMSLRDLPDLREFRELSDDTKATLRRDMNEGEIEVLGQEVLDFARGSEGEQAGDDVETPTEPDEAAEPEAELDEVEMPTEPEAEVAEPTEPEAEAAEAEAAEPDEAAEAEAAEPEVTEPEAEAEAAEPEAEAEAAEPDDGGEPVEATEPAADDEAEPDDPEPTDD